MWLLILVVIIHKMAWTRIGVGLVGSMNVKMQIISSSIVYSKVFRDKKRKLVKPFCVLLVAFSEFKCSS